MISAEVFLTQVKKVLDCDKSIGMDTNIYTDISFDSMQLIFLISLLEDENDVDVDIEKLSTINTLQDFYNLIGEKR